MEKLPDLKKKSRTPSSTVKTQIAPAPRSLHTPGPWHVHRSGGWTIRAGHAVPIATVATGVIEGAYRTEAIEANARLLAAAPELLAFAKAIVWMTEGEARMDKLSVIEPGITVRRKARQLVAQAEGAPSVVDGNDKHLVAPIIP